MWKALSQAGPLQPIDDPRHGRAGHLLGIGELSNAPVATEDQDGQGGELPRRDPEGLVGRAGPAHEVDGERVEPGCHFGESRVLHQIGRLPKIVAMHVDHLRQVAQHVADLDRAAAFYRDVVGLALIARFDPPGLVFFDLGTSRLLLDAAAPPALLYLGVDDVAAMTERLRSAGVDIVSEPHTIHVDEAGQFGPAGEAEEVSFFRDSEGNVVGLAGRRPVVEAPEPA